MRTGRGSGGWVCLHPSLDFDVTLGVKAWASAGQALGRSLGSLGYGAVLCHILVP